MQSVKTGKGPDTCLLLDISGSMEGEPFNEMMASVRTFIEGNKKKTKSYKFQHQKRTVLPRYISNFCAGSILAIKQGGIITNSPFLRI
jgi:hypothetical protein